MSLPDKPIIDVIEQDLLALIENQVSEGKTIDYKRDAVGGSDSDKKEFLYDASSFANASDGHLILGVDEKDGIPTKLVGLPGINPDDEIGRLEQLARDGIRPPILGLEMRAVPLATQNTAIVIRISKSWNPPHQVVYQKAFRFYGRGSNGKYLLDVDELRTIFSLSEAVGERIRQFRIERVAKVVASETPVPLQPGVRQILHLVPLSAFAAGATVDLSPLYRRDRGLFISVMGHDGSMRHNVDGLLASSMTGGVATAYAQAYRNGVLEIIITLQEWQPRGIIVLPSIATRK